jgi:hypothetical protein
MSLSNRPTLFVLICILALFLASCGSGPDNRKSSLSALDISNSGLPFSTIEPDVFQADFVVTADGSERRWFLARKNDRWRFDIFKNGERSFTQLRTEKVYLIDHISRIYTEEPQTSFIITAPDPILAGFFRGKEYHEFEDLGTEGGPRKYRVKRGDNSKDDIIILIDETSGMIVRQDFYEGSGEQARIALSYEVRDVKLNVEDVVFAVPTDYRRLDRDEFQRSRGSTSPPKEK